MIKLLFAVIIFGLIAIAIIVMLVINFMYKGVAERKKVINAILHISLRLERVFSVSRTKLNPPFESTISTMVIAPIRKNSVDEVSPRWSSMISVAFLIMSSPLSRMR